MGKSTKKAVVPDDLADEMVSARKEDASGGDKLDKVRETISMLRDLEFENTTLQERMSENSKRIKEIKDKTLVDMFDEVGINSLGIEADGNLPPYDIEIKPFYHANIPQENEKEAFAWLNKNKHGDLIKATYTVSFGRGEEKARTAFEKHLEKTGLNYVYKFGVPWNTLTAFIKEQIETYKREPPLKLLGATVGRVASLKKAKAERKKGK